MEAPENVIMLGDAEVRSRLTSWDQIIASVRTAYEIESRSEVEIKDVGLPVGRDGFCASMLGVSHEHDMIGTKYISYLPRSSDAPGSGFESFSCVVLKHVDGNRPTVITAGSEFTLLRTGGVVGLAARLLSPPVADRIACVGAGPIVQYAIRCLASIYPGIESVSVHTRNSASVARLASELADLDVRIQHEESLEAAVHGSPIVVSATPQGTRLEIPEGSVSPGAVVIALEGFEVWSRSIRGNFDLAFFDRAAMLTDFLETHRFAGECGLLRELLAPHSQRDTAARVLVASAGSFVTDMVLCRMLEQMLERDSPWALPRGSRQVSDLHPG